MYVALQPLYNLRGKNREGVVTKMALRKKYTYKKLISP